MRRFFPMDDDERGPEGPEGRRRGGRGGPGWAGAWGAPGGRGGAGFGRLVGQRARRGDVRTAVLAVLVDQDAHGYQIIQEIGARTDGAWAPSPGSVYPLLQQLEDEGLVVAREADGKRVFSITDAGRTEATARTEAAGRSPFDLDDTGGGLRHEAFLLMAAARQVGAAGTEAQRKQAEAVLADTRKALYRLLAES